MLIARNRFRGRAVLQSIVDLPFAVSPIIVGVAMISAWGSAGVLGFIERDTGVKIIFGVPGIVLASLFATLPFVVREVQLVLLEVGTEQEQAAATLGSSWWQTFWRVTIPSIRWGLTYGVVLTVARTLGEFGGVIMVSSNLAGEHADAHAAGQRPLQPRAMLRRLRAVDPDDGSRHRLPGRQGGPADSPVAGQSVSLTTDQRALNCMSRLRRWVCSPASCTGIRCAGASEEL